jgi:hypothetical protein
MNLIELNLYDEFICICSYLWSYNFCENQPTILSFWPHNLLFGWYVFVENWDDLWSEFAPCGAQCRLSVAIFGRFRPIWSFQLVKVGIWSAIFFGLLRPFLANCHFSKLITQKFCFENFFQCLLIAGQFILFWLIIL